MASSIRQAVFISQIENRSEATERLESQGGGCGVEPQVAQGASRLMCPRCDAQSLLKDGKNANGTQRYECKSCGKKFTEPHAQIDATKTDLSPDDCMEAYLAFGNVEAAAEYLGVREKSLQGKLRSEARKAGLSSVRMLLGDKSRSVENASVNRKHLVKLIEDQGYRCSLSGIELTPETASLDHTVPVAKGGEHVVGNVVWVHEEINRMKGQLSVEEFVSLCSKVVQYTR